MVSLPAKGCHFSLFMISLIQIGESFNVIESIYYAVKHFHNINSKPDPTNSTLVSYLLEAARRLCYRPSIKKQPTRYDEVSNLMVGDIILYDTHMKIFIEHSKTDQYREGAWVYIAKLDSPVCPVRTLKLYIERADVSCNNEFLFRAMTFFKKKKNLISIK